MRTIDDATKLFTSFFALESEVLKANLGGQKRFAGLYRRWVSLLADETVLSIPREDGADLLAELQEAKERTAAAVAPRRAVRPAVSDPLLPASSR